ncbi:MAG TPA: histidinol-phosphate transaminase [Bacillus bacterium]|nr:histidinol-phosphate transaminase [Bacillus sp. (in: firmicutes)]
MTYILPHIREMKPYEAGIQPSEKRKMIKLNLNENPFPPSQNVLRVLHTIQEDTLRLYPDQHCDELREALAKEYRVTKEQTFCGNGSSEIISLIFKLFIGPHRSIAIPDPTFSLYYSVASIYQVECMKIPTRDDFSVDIDLLLESKANAIILVNPNAPTGRLLDIAEVERLVSKFSGLVIVDEAYIDFANPSSSAIPLLKKYNNLIVIRTFSKVYSLCGIRVGYCFSNKEFITALETGRNLFNVNVISQKLALAALMDQEHLVRTTTAVKHIREAFSNNLRKLGFAVIPSKTNFILCSPPSKLGRNGAKELYNKLLERNIYVRYFETPRLLDKLRISIGTKEEMATLYNQLHQILQSETF